MGSQALFNSDRFAADDNNDTYKQLNKKNSNVYVIYYIKCYVYYTFRNKSKIFVFIEAFLFISARRTQKKTG